MFGMRGKTRLAAMRQLMESTANSVNKWGVLVAIGMGTFMAALDTSVVNTVLPVIGKSFNETITSVEWVVTIYLLVLSGLLLSFGRLGDIRGHKRIYLTGFAVFVLSSLTCGFAPNVVVLIIRVIAGIGARCWHPFTCHTDQVLSFQPARTSPGFASHNDIPGSRRGTLPGWVARKPVWLACGLLYKLSRGAFGDLAGHALYSPRFRP
jgi:MFS family permease